MRPRAWRKAANGVRASPAAVVGALPVLPKSALRMTNQAVKRRPANGARQHVLLVQVGVLRVAGRVAPLTMKQPAKQKADNGARAPTLSLAGAQAPEAFVRLMTNQAVKHRAAVGAPRVVLPGAISSRMIAPRAARRPRRIPKLVVKRLVEYGALPKDQHLGVIRRRSFVLPRPLRRPPYPLGQPTRAIASCIKANGAPRVAVIVGVLVGARKPMKYVQWLLLPASRFVGIIPL